jgi:hypothetical protein
MQGLFVGVSFSEQKEQPMIEHQADYCPHCNAIWPKAQERCAGCGYGLMNEGDLHSGPHGYSPNTAYPETQYGSDFDEEAEWKH